LWSNRWLVKTVIALISLVAVVLATGAVLALAAGTKRFLGLGLPEVIVLAILGVLLLGRKIPAVCRLLGQRMRSRNP
jgi:hypothetical protein